MNGILENLASSVKCILLSNKGFKITNNVAVVLKPFEYKKGLTHCQQAFFQLRKWETLGVTATLPVLDLDILQ